MELPKELSGILCPVNYRAACTFLTVFFQPGMWGNKRHINPWKLYWVAWNTEFHCRLISEYWSDFLDKSKSHSNQLTLSVKGFSCSLDSSCHALLLGQYPFPEFSPLSSRFTYPEYIFHWNLSCSFSRSLLPQIPWLSIFPSHPCHTLI